MSQLDLAHEILRTTRHFIHCLLDIQGHQPIKCLASIGKEQELEGHLQECENLHLEHMPTFQVEPEWYYIEWFMGFVFLAKAWGSLGDLPKCSGCSSRRWMHGADFFDHQQPSPQWNGPILEWWLSIATKWVHKCELEFAKSIGRLEVAMKESNSAAIATAIDDIVGPFVAPWSTGRTVNGVQ